MVTNPQRVRLTELLESRGYKFSDRPSLPSSAVFMFFSVVKAVAATGMKIADRENKRTYTVGDMQQDARGIATLDRMPEQRLKIVPDVVLTAGISGEQRLQQNQECQVLKELPEILRKLITDHIANLRDHFEDSIRSCTEKLSCHLKDLMTIREQLEALSFQLRVIIGTEIRVLDSVNSQLAITNAVGKEASQRAENITAEPQKPEGWVEAEFGSFTPQSQPPTSSAPSLLVHTGMVLAAEWCPANVLLATAESPGPVASEMAFTVAQEGDQIDEMLTEEPHEQVKVAKPEAEVMTYEDQAAKLCISTSPPQDQQLEVSSGDMNPCSSVLLDRATKKQEVFAKSKRIPLTVNTFTDEYLILFSELQVKPQVVVLPSIVSPWSNHNLHKTTRMRLGFPPPLSDFLSFSKQLQDNMVVLETCSITEHTLIGTVLVKNITYEKDVRLRITFDSWRSHHNVPCVYTEQSYEYPGTNTFSFNIPVPKNLEPHDRIEFCVSYQPGGYLTPLWDNNRGQNYCVILDPSGVQSMPHRE